jgi:hypothetical protein
VSRAANWTYRSQGALEYNLTFPPTHPPRVDNNHNGCDAPQCGVLSPWTLGGSIGVWNKNGSFREDDSSSAAPPTTINPQVVEICNPSRQRSRKPFARYFLLGSTNHIVSNCISYVSSSIRLINRPKQLPTLTLPHQSRSGEQATLRLARSRPLSLL